MKGKRLSPILVSLVSVFKIPIRPAFALLMPSPLSRPVGHSLRGDALRRPFSSGVAWAARKEKGQQGDRRVTLIRYFLYHPLTPRPLRFSRTRYLRHWTIHRTWQLYKAKQRMACELELQRQWQSMRAACEELRTSAGDGGKLFRISMNKKGVFRDGVPIEYGRLQTEGPSRDGWNYEWKR